ncbi:MAG: hypothetical protein A3H98_00245 [Bacteroidetes bacterium RIFCSPLOWO2_02_FULL_36_8]|nr:MAG: hypothetical protein A3H98_00245 [Bacteroidetes bacterium RIFCSPLOWO2_02_FULL_36_8]OFY70836.1 MAG: hypothetical protein A3G23_11990 [Bacteroidetes bacterium RIFCSPLOWO2_12_FULL_37_12]
MKTTGFLNGNPKIEKMKFSKGQIQIVMNDRRVIFCPLDSFPGIKKLSLKERKKYSNLAGFGIMFENSDEVYHLSDFLGLHNTQGL